MLREKLTGSQRKAQAADLRLRREYGITLEEYGHILKHQSGGCAICKRRTSRFKARLAVDHCHTSGLLRGLLCYWCNKALGVFGDNLDKLRAAVEYLMAPPATAVFNQPRFTAPGRVGTKRRAKLLKAMQEGI